MKKLIFILIIVSIFLTAFRFANEKNIATVDRQQGIYLFMLSQPTAKYEVLGTLKIKAAWTGQPGEMMNKMIRKVKESYPNAEGIIFSDINMVTAQAIIFKEQ
jgi:hypothetical protein